MKHDSKTIETRIREAQEVMAKYRALSNEYVSDLEQENAELRTKLKNISLALLGSEKKHIDPYTWSEVPPAGCF